MAMPVVESRITLPDIAEDPVAAIYVGGDPAVAELYKFKLEMDGYWVTLAGSGTQGLAQARERIPDVIFLDLGPADQSLLHMLRTLRRDRDLKDIPVVLLWRGDVDAPTIQSLRLGLKDFLVKASGTHPEHAWSDLSDSRPPVRYVQ
jgi:two-component system, OmpR family, response regulator